MSSNSKQYPIKIIATLSLIAILSVAACLYSNHHPSASSASSEIIPNNHDGHSQRLLSLGLPTDPKTITPRDTSQVVLSTGIPVTEISHEQDSLCVATVDNGNILTASVLDESGNVHLSLPKDYEAKVSVGCIDYERVPLPNKKVFFDQQSSVTGFHSHSGIVKQSDEPQICNPKSFRPGYFDTQTNMWHDHCTGRILDTDGAKAGTDKPWLSGRMFDTDRAKARADSPFLENNCPFVARRSKEKEPIWISFVGDSVTRELFQDSLPLLGVDMPFQKSSFKVLKEMTASSHGQEIWLSFQMGHLRDDDLDGNKPPYAFSKNNEVLGRIPYTWGHYVEQRNRGSYPDDPPFPDSKVPDIVLFGPGYHASRLSSATYGAMIEKILSHWRDELDEHYNVPMPPVHIILNMMPATWKIPSKHAIDRTYRTLLNEYRKNLAIMVAANKFDFVKSTIDFFSVELPFNRRGEYPPDLDTEFRMDAVPSDMTAHRDAVHLGDERVIRIIGDRALEAICNTE